MTDPQPDLWTPDLVLTAKGAPFAPIVSTGAIRLLTPDERSRRHGLDGAEDAKAGLPDAVRSSVREAILARSEPFTSDSLHGYLTQSARDVLRHKHHQNALAGILMTAAREGIIRHTGQYVRSVRPEARGRMLKLWERT